MDPQREDPTRFYGMYRGLIINNNDEYYAGRCQIQVYPMFTEMDPLLLPWAVPAMPLSAGAGAGFGTFKVPEIDTFVFVFFENGDPYQPVYFAEAQTAAMGIPQEAYTNYPYRRVVKSPSGITTTIDDIAVEAIIDHPAGTRIIITATGQVNVYSADGILMTAMSDIKLDAQKNVTINAGEDIDADALLNVTIHGLNVTVNADLKAQVNCRDAVVDAQKDVNVTAGATAEEVCQNAEVKAAVDAYIEGGAFVIIQGGIVSINPTAVA